ncbi:MAG TPA: chemotaxis protein CheR [Nitrospiraceae bacterium]|nr:chemotaxis protein CheR [Nitrospiraceae bacterium]
MRYGKDLEKMEIDILLEGIRRRYGYDFTHYSYASLKRRLSQARDQAQLTRYTEMLDHLYHDERFFDHFLKHMSIPVTEMFRDPPFYQAIREQIIPLLKTFPFVKIWHTGCATGEEVYSMVILLHEENFLDRVRIYATDFNKHGLDAAEKAVYPAKNIETYAANYRAAGGRRDFSDYYSSGYDLMKIKDFLKKNITFSYHNLVTDGVFGEMNLIFCRNVLIYFDRTLQDRVLRLFTDSLRHGGFLCLGNRETLNFTSVKSLFEPVESRQKIYKKQGELAHV